MRAASLLLLACCLCEFAGASTVGESWDFWSQFSVYVNPLVFVGGGRFHSMYVKSYGLDATGATCTPASCPWNSALDEATPTTASDFTDFPIFDSTFEQWSQEAPGTYALLPSVAAAQRVLSPSKRDATLNLDYKAAAVFESDFHGVVEVTISVEADASSNVAWELQVWDAVTSTMSDATRSVDAAGVAATTGGLGRTVAAAGSTFTGTYAVPITKAGLIALVCDRDGGKTDAQSEALGFNLTVTALSVCGSKVLDAGGGAVETCDDANAVSGDGCDRQCHIEPGWSCSYPADGDRSVCVKACSNGAIECADPKGPFCEQCDDGNLYPGDGCDADCQLEADFNCTTLTAGEKAEHKAPVINNVDDLGVQGGWAPGIRMSDPLETGNVVADSQCQMVEPHLDAQKCPAKNVSFQKTPSTVTIKFEDLPGAATYVRYGHTVLVPNVRSSPLVLMKDQALTFKVLVDVVSPLEPTNRLISVDVTPCQGHATLLVGEGSHNIPDPTNNRTYQHLIHHPGTLRFELGGIRFMTYNFYLRAETPYVRFHMEQREEPCSYFGSCVGVPRCVGRCDEKDCTSQCAQATGAGRCQHKCEYVKPIESPVGRFDDSIFIGTPDYEGVTEVSFRKMPDMCEKLKTSAACVGAPKRQCSWDAADGAGSCGGKLNYTIYWVPRDQYHLNLQSDCGVTQAEKGVLLSDGGKTAKVECDLIECKAYITLKRKVAFSVNVAAQDATGARWPFTPTCAQYSDAVYAQAAPNWLVMFIIAGIMSCLMVVIVYLAYKRQQERLKEAEIKEEEAEALNPLATISSKNEAKRAKMEKDLDLLKKKEDTRSEVLQEKRYGISVATIRKQKKETEKLPNSLKNMRNKTGANAGSTLPKEIEEAHKRRKENRYLDL